MCALSVRFALERGMIVSTIPAKLVLGSSGIRAASRFRSAILADFETRGFAISTFRPAGTASLSFLLSSLCRMPTLLHREGSQAVLFCTVGSVLPVYRSVHPSQARDQLNPARQASLKWPPECARS